MSETKWTKGPLTAEENLRGDGTSAGWWAIYGGPVGSQYIGEATRKHDALLFAAAPDLAEALEAATAILASVAAANEYDDMELTPDGSIKLSTCRAALARAKGAS